jgi:hypothetical protein
VGARLDLLRRGLFEQPVELALKDVTIGIGKPVGAKGNTANRFGGLKADHLLAVTDNTDLNRPGVAGDGMDLQTLLNQTKWLLIQVADSRFSKQGHQFDSILTGKILVLALDPEGHRILRLGIVPVLLVKDNRLILFQSRAGSPPLLFEISQY